MSTPSTLVLACKCGAENHLVWELGNQCGTRKALIRCWCCFATIGQLATQSAWSDSRNKEALITRVAYHPSPIETQATARESEGKHVVLGDDSASMQVRR